MVATILFFFLGFTNSIKLDHIISTEFDYEVADDMVQLAWDCYNQYPDDSPGDQRGRDLDWVVQMVLSPIIGGMTYTEGYIYTHESAIGSDNKPICAVGIQGTDNLADVITDISIDVVEIVSKTTDEHFWIHKGVVNRLSKIISQEGVVDYIKDDCSLDVLYVVGHSLGGGVAQLWTLAMLEGIKSVEGASIALDLDQIEHNVQTYTYSGMKIFSRPFDVSHFPLWKPVMWGIKWYHENVPCPESLAGNHLHRIFTSTRDSDGKFTVDYIVVNHPLGIFRFCSHGYELDLNTGLLTEGDLRTPDWFNSEISYDIHYHRLKNHIPALHMPKGVYVQSECSDSIDIDDLTKYALPSEKKKVRCCKTDGDSVTCTSRKSGSCSGKMTFTEATNWCKERGDGYDICSAEQISSCCHYNSCWYNDDEVWIKAVIEKTEDNSVETYPTYEVDDERCRGFLCDATKYGILYLNNPNHPMPDDYPTMPTIGEYEEQIVDEYVEPTAEPEEIEIARPKGYHNEEKIKEQMVAMTKQIFAEYNAKETELSYGMEMMKKYGVIVACAAIIILCLFYLAYKKRNARQISYVAFSDEDVI